MNRWISLLRGVNVGGRNILPMKELRALLEKLGFENVKTYIQSGNLVFDADAASAKIVSETISKQIGKAFDIHTPVVTLSVAQLRRALKQNPYEAYIDNPKDIHFFFLANAPKTVDSAALNKLKKPTEQFHIKDSVFYLYAPEGIARSKLAANVEAKISVTATARNYRTSLKLSELAIQA